MTAAQATGTDVLAIALHEFTTREGLVYRCAVELLHSESANSAQWAQLQAFTQIWDDVSSLEDAGETIVAKARAEEGVQRLGWHS